MMKKSIICNLFLLWTILSGSVMFAQTVKGVVFDESGPIPQVNINIKGTAINTVTDLDGKFTINNVDSKAILVFSYIGYLKQEVSVSGKTELLVTLKSDVSTLSEVVVVGYVGQKKASITSAVAAVNMDDLSKTKVSDVAQALQGQVAGVFVAANTGAPGDGVKIRIRGEGTLGNNDVLYVVDGVSTRDISFLNQSDVKSMTVLKDAAAGAVYGSRAAGGVVVITTKNGQQGKSTIAAEYYTGFHFAVNLPEMLNADQYLSVKDQAWHNTAGNSATAISPYAADKARGSVNGISLADTDWQDELFETGISRNFQASVSGGSENVQYLISGGYYGIDGIVVDDHDKYQRINFRANVNANLSDRLKVGTNLQISETQQDKLSSSGDSPGVIRHALLRSPVMGVYKDVNDPTYSEDDPYTDLPFYSYIPDPNNAGNYIGVYDSNYEKTSNPIAIVHFTDDKRDKFQTFGNVYAEYAFLNDKSLKFKSNLGADLQFSHNKNFAANFGDDYENNPNDQYPGLGRNNRPNYLGEERGQSTTYTFSNTLNYVKTFNEKHNVNLLLGEETISSNSDAMNGSRDSFDITSGNFRYLDFGSRNVNMYSGGRASKWDLLSYFASGTYGYDNKYFATATVRADASSRFGPNNKWGYFPSVSGGWIISKEDFMQKMDWISNLKLRASWGQSGNQEIPDHTYETLVSSEDGEGEPTITRYGNPDLKWETTTQTNFGLDLSVLKNKLSFTTDYFIKDTDDILLNVPLPVYAVGLIEPTIVNAGAVNNKGFEFGLNFQNHDHAFKYSVNANVATLTNNVDKLQTYVANITDNATHTRTEVGHAINSYYGYVFDGIYQNAAEVSSTLFSNTNGTVPGDIKFKDINADGQINADDRAFIGNPIPKTTYGLQFSGDYKNFDISFLLQGVEGVDRYNDLKQILDYDSRPFNSTTDVLNSWHGEGTSNTTPRLTFNNNGGGNVSSVYVEDASYLRLKNIEIGYTFEAKSIGLKHLRVYASAQNLFTITDYSGLDPESTSLIDKGTYPQSQSFIMGLQVKL